MKTTKICIFCTWMAFSLSIAIGLIGCVKRSQDTAAATQTSNTTQSEETVSSGDTNLNNPNLFELSTASDPVPSVSPSPSAIPISASSYSCLTGTTDPNHPYQVYGATSIDSSSATIPLTTASTALSPTCFEQGTNSNLQDPSLVLNRAVDYFDSMNYCLQLSTTKLAQICSADGTLSAAATGIDRQTYYLGIVMGMVRCARWFMNTEIRQSADWAPDVQNQLNYADQGYYDILQQVSAASDQY